MKVLCLFLSDTAGRWLVQSLPGTGLEHACAHRARNRLVRTRPYPVWLWSLGLLVPLTMSGARADGTAAAQTAPGSAPAVGPAPTPATPTPVAKAVQEAAQQPTPGSTLIAQAPADEKPAAAAEQKPAPPSLDISGFVDFYYEYNFNRPPAFNNTPGGARVRNDIENKLRNFDFKHNEFALNLAELVVQRAPAPVGFKLKFAYGKATDWIHL